MRNACPAPIGRGLVSRILLLSAVSLSVVLVGAPVQADPDYDPSRPTSNRTLPGDSGPSRRVALGVANRDDRSMADLDALTTALGGNTPAIAVIKSAWGEDNSRDFPTSTAQAMASRGITPMIWWTPRGGSDTELYSRHRNINLGLHDDYIRQYARDARQFDGQVLLRFAHEINNHYFPWSVNSYDNTPESFIAAWRRVHGIFRAQGANNVKFVWSVAKEVCEGGCNPYTRVYPGDQYVDVMGFSGYNWGATKGWISMYDAYRRPANLLAQISDKPVMVAETGSNEIGGSKAEWIRTGYREIHERLPQISAIVWTNVDLRYLNHPDWRIDSSPSSLAAYAEIASLDDFRARSLFASARATKIRDRGDDRTSERSNKAKAAKAARAAKAAEARRQAQTRQAPRVVKGSKGDDAPPSPAKKQRSRTTKPQKPGGSEPVDTLDSFSR